MPPENKPRIQLEVVGETDMDAMRRANALSKAAQYLETDVLEILAKKCTQKGINDKVRKMQYLI